VYGTGRGEHCGAAGGEGESNELMASHLKVCLPVWRDLHDSALSREGSGYIEISIHIEGKPLGTPESTIKISYASLSVNFVYGIET